MPRPLANTNDQRFFSAILDELKAVRRLLEGLAAPPLDVVEKPARKPRKKKDTPA